MKHMQIPRFFTGNVGMVKDFGGIESFVSGDGLSSRCVGVTHDLIFGN